MDRSWMNHNRVKDRQKKEYIASVENFLDFAFKKKTNETKLKCPCLNCRLVLLQNRKSMHCHLLVYGVDSSYNPWTSHGEVDEHSSGSEDAYEVYTSNRDEDLMTIDDMAPLIFDATNVWNSTTSRVHINNREHTEHEEMRANYETPKDFDKLMEDIEADLYPGCKTFKRMEFLITLLHVKVSCKMTDKAFSLILEVLHRAFNYDKNFPASFYEAKKYTKALGLDYVKIDACINHCILFRDEYANMEACPKCGASRWKKRFEVGDIESEEEGAKKMTQVPRLILRHFPLIPRLQRMFISSNLAKHMRWHKDGRLNDDDVMRHPADSKAWKSLDRDYPDFAMDARNVRLGLSSDGFNPGATLSSRYSIWPVLLVPYNLLPWMCMKSDNMMLSLLIPSPKSPGNDIDVFLQPLIDELKELWETGVNTYDAHRKETFNMRAVLMWTIQDFPAYANLSGWSTKGTLACPNCRKNTCSYRLKDGHKWCYMGHRKFLDANHKWRFNKSSFGGKVENDPPPVLLTGDDVLEDLSGYSNVQFGRRVKESEKKAIDIWFINGRKEAFSSTYLIGGVF